MSNPLNAGVQDIGDGLYTVTLPSGQTVIVNGNGDIAGETSAAEE